MAPALSPSGQSVAFIRRTDGKGQVSLLELRSGKVRTIAQHGAGLGSAASTRHLRGVSPPQWSPDGSRLAYVAPVAVGPRSASTMHRVAELPYQFDGRGRTDDNHLQVFIVDVSAGNAPRQWTFADSDHWDISWRPDGQAVCVAAHQRLDNGTRVEDVFEIELDGTRRRVTDGTVTVNLPTYSPDSETIYFTGIGPLDRGEAAIRGRNMSLWKVDSRVEIHAPTLLIDREGFDFDDNRLRPLFVDADGVVTLARVLRGSVELGEVRQCSWKALTKDQRQVLSYARSGEVISAVIADHTHAGDLFVRRGGELVRRTGFCTEYADVSRVPGIELMTNAEDGYPVHGWLLLPTTPSPHPLLLLIHGGPDIQWGYFLNEDAQVYAGAGFAVLMPNPRGSAGYGEAHARAVTGRLGTVDVLDVMTLLDLVVERGDIDAARVGVLGRSYGGFMTAWLAAHHGERFGAAVGECGAYDWGSMVSTSDIGWQLTGMVGEDPTQWAAQSALTYAQDVKVPFMVMHYLSDLRVPTEQAQRYFSALLRSGAPTELVQFDGGPHGFAEVGPPADRVARLEAIVEWFRRWLKV